jgi:hypothetical protein
MCDRDAGIRRSCNASRYSGNDLEWKSGFRQRLRLLATTPEHERISALEPHDALPLSHQPDQKLIYRFLARRSDGIAATLANVVQFRGSARFFPGCAQQFGVGEGIVNDGIGAREQGTSANSYEIRIARSGANEKCLASAAPPPLPACSH